MSKIEPLVICFGRASLRLRRLLDKRMMRQGASLARTKLLMYLDVEGPARSADIADFFTLSPRTVTEAIDGLERAGMVRRDPDPDDRRAKRISITPAGREAIAATEPIRLDLIGRIFGALDEDERRQLAALLDKLTAALALEEARTEQQSG